MSDPEPIKEETPEEKTGPVDQTPEVPESTDRDKGEEPKETTEAVPDNEAARKRKNLLIAVGVAVVIILVAVCAFVYITTPVATKGDTVSVYYTVAFDNGTVYESNMNNTVPIVFTLGNSSIITGFEEAVTGMSVNQIKTVDLPYTKAYGAYDPGLVQTFNRTGPIANTTF